MTIIVTGNPISGFEFFGPFDDETAAVEWADGAFDDSDWWVGTVEKPNE